MYKLYSLCTGISLAFGYSLASTPEIMDRIRETAECGRDYRIIEGADHFWGGYEDRLGKDVVRFFNSHFRRKE